MRLLIGDCVESMRSMEAGSVHCCVTSPPYFGLRDYGHDGQIGLEATPDEYVARLVEVFREVRRVLRDDGTLWLNLGDSYSNGGRTMRDTESPNKGNAGAAQPHRPETGAKPKDLLGIPWRVAFALQQPYYAGRIRDVMDRIWLAAMIDAEGCLFIHKRKAGTDSGARFTKADGTTVSYERKQDTYGAGLEVANTHLSIVERCRAITGLGAITTQDKDRRQPLYRWHLRGDEARSITREVYPYLVAKQHQARLLCGCPTSGEQANAAHQALMGLHGGTPTDVDFKAPAGMTEPGYYLRQDIIWSKLNPMPESVRDRCTKAHEYIFLLSKSERYWFDSEAMQEPATGAQPGNKSHKYASAYEDGSGEHRTKAGLVAYAERQRSKRDSFKREGSKREQTIPGQGYGTHRPDREESTYNTGTRNRRSVWTVATKPYKGAHFATFPPDLIRPCILAGCPPKGRRCDCDEVIASPTGSGPIEDPTMQTGRAGMNRPRRDDEGTRPITRREQRHEAIEMKASPHRPEMERECGPAFAHYIRTDRSGARPLPNDIRKKYIEAGWITEAPPCTHPIEEAGTVLDPFGGSGTTALVALEEGRDAVLCELNESYAPLIHERVGPVTALIAKKRAQYDMFA